MVPGYSCDSLARYRRKTALWGGGPIATSSPQVAIMLQFSVQSKGTNLRHGVFSMDSMPMRGTP